MDALWKLINWPDAIHNASSADLRFLQAEFVVLQKTRLSSANLKQGIFEVSGPSLRLKSDFGFRLSKASFWTRKSKQRIKRYGKSGSPCLDP